MLKLVVIFLINATNDSPSRMPDPKTDRSILRRFWPIYRFLSSISVLVIIRCSINIIIFCFIRISSPVLSIIRIFWICFIIFFWFPEPKEALLHAFIDFMILICRLGYFIEISGWSKVLVVILECILRHANAYNRLGELPSLCEIHILGFIIARFCSVIFYIFRSNIIFSQGLHGRLKVVIYCHIPVSYTHLTLPTTLSV